MPTVPGRLRALLVLVALALIALAAPMGGVPTARGPATPVRALATAHAPIRIYGNAQFTAANGVVSGQGTAAKPYLIADWSISASSAIGVDVRNTTAYFTVSRVDVCCGLQVYPGMYLSNVSHASVFASNVNTSLIALHVDDSSNVTVTGGNYSSFSNAMEIWYSNYVNVSGTNLTASAGLGVWGNVDYLLDFWSNNVDSPQSQGMILSASSHVRIGRNTFTSTATAIQVPDLLMTGLFAGNNVNSWDGSGLVLGSASYLTISRNYLSGQRGYDLDLGAGHDNVVANNSLFGGVDGCARFQFVQNTSIQDNQMAGCGGQAFDVENTGINVVLASNTVTGARNGILLYQAYGTTVRGNALAGVGIRLAGTYVDAFRDLTITPDNLISGRPILYSKDCGALAYDRAAAGEILAANCTSLSLSNTSFTEGSVPIQAAFVGSVSLLNVSVANQNDSGFLLQDVGRASIVRSRFSSNWFGENATAVGALQVLNTTFEGFQGLQAGGGTVDFRGDAFSSMSFGLHLSGATGGTILDSRFVGMQVITPLAGRGEGLLAASSRNVTVVNSTFAGDYYGVDLAGDRGFLLYHNTFDSNAYQAADDGGFANAWNASYPTGGNNWTDYRGWDDCHGPLQDNCTAGDGIGDVPYVLYPYGLEDHYPLLAVNPPKVPPVALLIADATTILLGGTVTFTSASYDPTGWTLANETWDFGDGTVLSAVSSYMAHTYASAGTYTVRLTVESLRRLTNSTSLTITVVAPQPLALEDYVSPRGYIVPVPSGWSRTYNWTSGGYTYELLLQGSAGGSPANMIVDTEPTSSVQETHAYLNSVVQQTLQSIRQNLPDAYLVGAVQILNVSGHLGAVFEIGYTAHPLVQFALLVVSQAHERAWTVILSGASFAEDVLNLTFAKVVQGFSITLAAPSTAPPTAPPTGTLDVGLIVLLLLILAAPILVVVLYLVLGRRPPAARTAPGACTACGAPLDPAARFCGKCGTVVMGGPPPPP